VRNKSVPEAKDTCFGFGHEDLMVHDLRQREIKPFSLELAHCLEQVLIETDADGGRNSHELAGGLAHPIHPEEDHPPQLVGDGGRRHGRHQFLNEEGVPLRPALHFAHECALWLLAQECLEKRRCIPDIETVQSHLDDMHMAAEFEKRSTERMAPTQFIAAVRADEQD
jgi:hypothetical protein